MQTREIDLLDMVADILAHWRGLVIALGLGAVLFGGFGYLKTYRTVQNVEPQQDNTQNEESVQEQIIQLEQRLDDAKEASVLATLADERKYTLQKTYYENSVYMQLDPLQIAQIELIYKIQTADGSSNGQLGALCESLTNSVGLYNWVAQKTGLEPGYVMELVSAETIPVLNLSEESLELTVGTDCVKVTILQGDEESCHTLAEAVKAYISQQQEKFSGQSGEYKLELLSESAGTTINKDILSDQADCEKEIISLQSAIAAEKAGFTEEQKQYYELLTKEEVEQDGQIVEEKEVTESVVQAPVVSKKEVILGAALFAFVYVLMLSLGYIFSTRIRVSDDLQKMYGISQIGLVVKESRKKNILDKWVDSLRCYGKRKFSAEQSVELAYAAVKIATVKNGFDSICLMGCNMEAGAEKVCESLRKALEEEQIRVVVLDNVLYDAEAMEKVNAMQGAILVEKAGSTLYNEITSELELLKRQEIPVLGGIIVE